MDSGSSLLEYPTIGTVAFALELFFDLVEESSRRVVSIAQLCIAASCTSMED
jgi:hypothetical protein